MPVRRFNRSFNNNTIISTIISIEELAEKHFKEIKYHDKLTKAKINVQGNVFLSKHFSEEEIHKISSFKTFKRQIEWISGRYAVKSLIAERKPELEYRNIVIETKTGGSPFIKSLPDIHISISHSRGFASAAVSFDKSIRTGVDIEMIGAEKSKEFKRLVFTDKEIEYFKDKDAKYMYLSWSVKEAYLKYIEKGFDVSMKRIELFDNEIYVDNNLIKDLKVHTETFEDKFIFAIVHNITIDNG